MKLLLSFLIFFNFLFSNEINESNQTIIKPKYIYLKYIKYPKVIYSNQRFSLVLSANILLKDKFYIINTRITPYKNVAFLNDEVTWYKTKDIITTTLNFKATNNFPILPTFIIDILDFNQSVIDTAKVTPPKIFFRKIKKSSIFSNIVATSLNILFVKTKQYSNNELLTYLEIEATNSNLEDFSIKNYKGFKLNLIQSKNTQILKYNIILPISKKELKFTYFNTKNNEFTLITIPIELKEDIISTQTDINPINNDLLFYKQMILLSLILFLLIIFVLKRNKFILVIIVSLSILLIYISLPNKKIIIKSNTKIYLLPTKNSNIFKIAKQDLKVEVLMEKNRYLKILLPDKKVGWIQGDCL